MDADTGGLNYFVDYIVDQRIVYCKYDYSIGCCFDDYSTHNIVDYNELVVDYSMDKDYFGDSYDLVLYLYRIELIVHYSMDSHYYSMAPLDKKVLCLKSNFMMMIFVECLLVLA